MDDFEMEVRIIDLVIDTEEIKDFFFQELIRRGYVPDEIELDEIADICFDYLIEKGVIDEEDEEAD